MRIGPVELAIIALVLVVMILIVMGRQQQRSPNAVIEEIFNERAIPTPGTKARVWALGVLNEAGADADADPLYATKVLRQAEPRLTLAAARVLVNTLNQV